MSATYNATPTRLSERPSDLPAEWARGSQQIGSGILAHACRIRVICEYSIAGSSAPLTGGWYGKEGTQGEKGQESEGYKQSQNEEKDYETGWRLATRAARRWRRIIRPCRP